jgi:hypothetical protein
MKTEILGLLALGVLNIVLGILVAFVCFRLSQLNNQITELENRISRLEILTSLSDSTERKTARGQGQTR